MNAADKLVAVSNFDDRQDIKSLPRVGDYQQIDWEKLASLKPSVMVIQMHPDRMPPGLVQQAQALGIKLVNIRIDSLADVFTAARQLGDEALADPTAGKTLAESIQKQLDAIRDRVKDKPRVRTLIVVDSAGQYVAGRGGFLSDLLDLAGAENVIPAESGQYPSIDRETLLALRPDVVLQLLPGASQQVLEKAQTTWATLPGLPAVKSGRVYTITDWFVHHPSNYVAATAEIFAGKLHPTNPNEGTSTPKP